MKQVITTEKLPIKLWLGDIEAGALTQAKNLANLPFLFKHVALMPDAHQGYGMPIGGVIATTNVVIPNAVGVDIGCGVSALKLPIHIDQLSRENLKAVLSLVRKAVPVGFDHHKHAQDSQHMPITGACYDDLIINREYNSALKQLGTLGGGNHFIEIQQDTEGFVWIMVHSGSRNLGKKVADHYNRIAVKLNEQWFSRVEKKQELAFLPIDTAEARAYMIEMQFCVDFALASRNLMMDRIFESFEGVLGRLEIGGTLINIAHNYARWENHFGHNVIVHRKGATSAKVGEIGLIPGSMGTRSYVVEGLGNPESFMSCSHGAGRKMGRGQATRELNLEKEIWDLEEQGIIHGLRNVSDLDEAPGAYKNIETVMENQSDLVKIIHELKPLAVIKG